jgi:non-ribosomal peptide synthetase component E (peptide arylation enzyme)
MLARHPLEGVRYRADDEVDAFYRCGAWLRLTLRDAIRAAGARHGERAFLIEGDRVVSYARYDADTERLAAALLARGLRPGDRALFQMGTCIETAVALGGCFKAGVIPVCTLAQHREIEIGQLGSLTAPRGYFVQADFSASFDLLAFARRMAGEIGTVHAIVTARGGPADLAALEALAAGGDLATARAAVDAVALDPADVCVFQLSGGSTGVPKVIPRMHGEYLAQARDWNDRFQLRAEDTAMWCLPLIHNAGTVACFLPALWAGRAMVLLGAFHEEAFLAAIERHRVAFTGSIGPIAGRLLDSPLAAKFDLSSMRQVWAFNRADDLEHRLGLPSQCIFGITEGILMGSSPDASTERRHGTVGNPVGRRDEILVRAPDGDCAVPDGELGELCFRGASVLSAYYRMDRTPDQFTADVFFRTGDLVRARWVDGERCFVFEGRMKDNISRGGEKYGAEEVEALVVKHPALLDARVVAMPDPLYGERGCVYVIARQGMAAPSVADLGAFLGGLGLAKYKFPERVETIDQFPLTRVGKVDKAELRARIRRTLQEEAERKP